MKNVSLGDTAQRYQFTLHTKNSGISGKFRNILAFCASLLRCARDLIFYLQFSQLSTLFLLSRPFSLHENVQGHLLNSYFCRYNSLSTLVACISCFSFYFIFFSLSHLFHIFPWVYNTHSLFLIFSAILHTQHTCSRMFLCSVLIPENATTWPYLRA